MSELHLIAIYSLAAHQIQSTNRREVNNQFPFRLDAHFSWNDFAGILFGSR